MPAADLSVLQQRLEALIARPVQPGISDLGNVDHVMRFLADLPTAVLRQLAPLCGLADMPTRPGMVLLSFRPWVIARRQAQANVKNTKEPRRGRPPHER